MSDTEDDNEYEDYAEDLIAQLRESTNIAKDSDKLCKQFELSKEQLESFILNSTGKLVQDSLDTINAIQEVVLAAPNPEEVHSLAELYKASTHAIEALNKILIQDKKAATQVGIKQMDIESKSALQDKKQEKRLLTRSDIIKGLIDSAEELETVEVVETEDDISDQAS